jgi:hypothetical protein
MHADSPLSKWMTSNFFSCVTKFTEAPSMPLLPEYKMYKESIDQIVSVAQAEKLKDEAAQRREMVDHGVRNRRFHSNNIVPSGAIGEILFTGRQEDPIKLRLMSEVAGGGLCKEMKAAETKLSLSLNTKFVSSTPKDSNARVDIPKDIYVPWVSGAFDRRLVVASSGKRYIKLDAAVEFAYLSSVQARNGAAHSNTVVMRIYPNRACKAGTWGTIGANINRNVLVVHNLNKLHNEKRMSNTNVYDAWNGHCDSNVLMREMCRDRFKALFDVGITHHPLVRVPDRHSQNYVHDCLNRASV